MGFCASIYSKSRDARRDHALSFRGGYFLSLARNGMAMGFRNLPYLNLMKRSGTADLPLHHGKVPPWLASRMALLGGAITESIVMEYGRSEFMKRLSDPFWFQALGCVMGMDWHSSGITTSVMGALKRSLNPRAAELGIHICGGRGKHSRRTPEELLKIANKTGLDGLELVKASRLSAKIDNTAIQDGFQIYLHTFVVTDTGEWSVIQQGMNGDSGYARRYHWHSEQFDSFVDNPHTSVVGTPQGLIINAVHEEAGPTRQGVLDLTFESPDKIITEARRLFMPHHHDVRSKDVNLKRLGTTLATAHGAGLDKFEDVLLLEGVGPRTLQSLLMVSEVIHGTASRFEDPARFAFAHGGKDGHPFPVPINVYDETISVLKKSVELAKVGQNDKAKALQSLGEMSRKLEDGFTVTGSAEELIEHERKESWKYGGRTIFGKAKPPGPQPGDQLDLF